MTLEEAYKTYTQIKIQPKTLDENMLPAFELINQSCLRGKDGQCHKCEHFVGVDLSKEEGAIYSYSVYTGFCEKEKEDGTHSATA